MAPATIMSDSEFILGNGDNPVHNGEPRNKSEVEVATRWYMHLYVPDFLAKPELSYCGRRRFSEGSQGGCSVSILHHRSRMSLVFWNTTSGTPWFYCVRRHGATDPLLMYIHTSLEPDPDK